ncbi:MAG: hypothetical protein IJ453_03415 [Oscillospiraceae bacterium]|nr:hypothetical protein [Oscillospiraceae bacterium]
MNTEQFIHALGQIDDSYLEEAIAAPRAKYRSFKWLEIAACACIVLALAAFIGFGLLPMGTAPELPPVIVSPSTEESEDTTVPTEPATVPSTEPSTVEPSQSTEPGSNTAPTESTEPSTQPPTTTEPPTEPSTTESMDIPPALPTLPSLLCVNGAVYELLEGESAEPDAVSALTLLGIVQSSCLDVELPDDHLEANEPIVGAEVYADGERLLVVVNGYVRIYVRYGG